MALTRVQGNNQGALVAGQFMDVIIRVEGVRSFGVKCMVSVRIRDYGYSCCCLIQVQLLRDSQMFTDRPGNIQEILYAAVWLVGEFARLTY